MDFALWTALYYKLLLIKCYIDYLNSSLKKSYLESLIAQFQQPFDQDHDYYQLQIEVGYSTSKYLPLVLADSKQPLSINNLIERGIVNSLLCSNLKLRKITADTARFLWARSPLFVHHCTLVLIKVATFESQNKNKEHDLKKLMDYFISTNEVFDKDESCGKIYQSIVADFIDAAFMSDCDLTSALRTLNCSFKLAFVDYKSEDDNTSENSNEDDDKVDSSTALEDMDILDSNSFTATSVAVLNEQQPLIYLPKHYFNLLYAQINKTKIFNAPILSLLQHASLIMLKLMKHYSVRPECIESVSSVFWQLWNLFLLHNEKISIEEQSAILLSPHLMELHQSLGYVQFVLKALEIYKDRNNLNKHVICSLLILSNLLTSEHLCQAYKFIEELLNNNINLDLDNEISEFIKLFLIRINEDLTGELLQDEELQKNLYGRLERLATSGVFRTDQLRQSLMDRTRSHANTAKAYPMDIGSELQNYPESDLLNDMLNQYKLKGTEKPKPSQSSNSFFSQKKEKKPKVTWQVLPIIMNIDFLLAQLYKNSKQIEILEKTIQDLLHSSKDEDLTIEVIMADLDLVSKQPALSKQCQELRDLYQENQTFNLLIQEQTLDEPAHEKEQLINKNDISLTVSGQQYIFSPKLTPGDGWCAFYAAGLNDPTACIDSLLKSLMDDSLCQDLAYAILQNYISSLPIPGLPANQQHHYTEEFDIDKTYKNKIIKLYQKWDEADEKNRDADYKNLMQYLSQNVVIKSYLTFLKRNRYANIAIVKAYLEHILHKQIGMIVKYGSQYYADLPAVNDQNTLYVLFEPSQRMSLAHYTKLELKNLNTHNLQLAISHV